MPSLAALTLEPNMKYLVSVLLAAAGAASAASVVPASMSSLPPEVRSTLRGLCRDCVFADAGGVWNATDVLSDADVPQRRLISIEHTGTEWEIHYEHGGRGQHKHSVTISTEPTARVVATSSCMPSATCREW